jgi:hypothetical protein
MTSRSTDVAAEAQPYRRVIDQRQHRLGSEERHVMMGTTPTGPYAPASTGQLARQQAIKQIERRRRFWTRAFVSGIVMIILVIIWATSEYVLAGGWPTSGFSDMSSIHVWNYWIIYPLVIWAALLAAWGRSLYWDKPISESAIDREVGRQTRVPR